MTIEMLNSGRIYDLAALAVVIVAAISYYKKGFLAGLVSLCGNIACVVCASLVAKSAVPALFQWLFGGQMVQGITKALSEGEVGVQKVLDRYSTVLPASLQETIMEQINELTQNSGGEIAQQIVSQVIQPLVAPILNIMIFLVAYAVLRLLVNMVTNLLQVANGIPLLGGANRMMGLCLGAVTGAVDAFLLFCLLWAVCIITNNQWPYLNQTILNQSSCFEIFEQLKQFV